MPFPWTGRLFHWYWFPIVFPLRLGKKPFPLVGVNSFYISIPENSPLLESKKVALKSKRLVKAAEAWEGALEQGESFVGEKPPKRQVSRKKGPKNANLEERGTDVPAEGGL